MHTAIRVHPSRASQLRAIAANAGTSVAAILERLISVYVEAGEHDRFDDLTLSRIGDEIALTIADYDLPPVSITTGRLINDAFDNQLAGIGGPASRVAVTPAHNVEIRRAGVGFRIGYLHAESAAVIASTTITREMLVDLVRQIGRVTL